MVMVYLMFSVMVCDNGIKANRDSDKTKINIALILDLKVMKMVNLVLVHHNILQWMDGIN